MLHNYHPSTQSILLEVLDDLLTESHTTLLPQTPRLQLESLFDTSALTTHCSDAWEEYQTSKKCLYRAVSLPDNQIHIVDPTTRRRQSTGSTDHVNVLLSEVLNSWRGYPPRDRSLCCSNSLATARSYGRIVFAVFPYDGCKLAVSHHEDLWDSFRVSNLEAVLNSIIQATDPANPGHELLEYRARSVGLGMDSVMDLGEALKDIGVGDTKVELDTWLRDTKLYDVFDRLLAPTTNDFTLVSGIANLRSQFRDPTSQHEIWFSAPAVLVPLNLLETMRSKSFMIDRLLNPSVKQYSKYLN